MAIIRAILRGERNPLELAKLRNDHCKRTEAQIARALYGNWRAEHLFALQQAVTLYDCYRQQLQVCDEQLHACLKTFADQSHGRPRPQRQVRRRLLQAASTCRSIRSSWTRTRIRSTEPCMSEPMAGSRVVCW